MTMPWLALALALAGAAAPAATPAPAPGLAGLADDVAARLGAPEEGRRGLALALAPGPAPLRAPLGAALAASLGRAGWAVSPVPAGPEAEAAARGAGADWLLTLTAGAGPGGRDLVAVGQAVPLWPSFFLQARPGVPAAPPRLVSARAPADAAALLLLGGGAPPPAPTYTLRALTHLDLPVAALAAGEVEGLGPSILAVGPDSIRLLDAAGREVAARSLDGAGRRPLRRPAAAAVVAPLGGGPIGVALAGAGGGEVLARRGARLERVAPLPMAPLAAGGAGVLFGAFAPGKAALQDLLSLGVDPAARPRAEGDLVAAAAAPRGSTPAFAVLHPGGRLELLDGALGPAGQVTGVGAGFALCDLDGDGGSEVVASASGPSAPGEPDRIRILRPGAQPPLAPGERAGERWAPAELVPRWTSPPLEGAVLAAAAFDLTGDGLDDAILAAQDPCPAGAAPGPACGTTLWLLTLDPREAR